MSLNNLIDGRAIAAQILGELKQRIAALKARGYGFQNITHVFLTHIHLDHAGASGIRFQGSRTPRS